MKSNFRMKEITIQLNHPGKEKEFKLGAEQIKNSGFYEKNGQIIREWNDGPHFRKYIKNKGIYVEQPKAIPNEEILTFWGEWEGYSKFDTSEKTHIPFHTIIGRKSQNTDPYVFGDCFKYAICSQKGVMTDLCINSMILFGTTTNKGFELDTVFIVKNFEKAESVAYNNGKNFTQTYKEATLEQLGCCYLGENPSKKNKIYNSRTWWDDVDKNFFSYVPCKLGDNKRKKVLIPFEIYDIHRSLSLSEQKIGHPYKHFLDFKVQDVWQYITDIVIQQGFYLGIKLYEPILNNSLANYNEEIVVNKKCY